MNSRSNEEEITPETIGKITFRIPLYQRPYTWEEKQVRQLLDDLNGAKGSDEPYYIGILSVGKIRDDPNRYDLIDGQQRITTIILIGKAASKFYDEGWPSFLTKERLKLYGREAEQAFLDSDPTDYGSPELDEGTMLKAFENAEQYFNDLEKDEAQKLARYIYEKAAFFISEAPPKYSLTDKNQKFVRMNNRGRQLEKHEILKVRLTKELSDEKEQGELLCAWNEMLSYMTGSKEDEKSNLTLENILNEKPGKNGQSYDKIPESFCKPIITIPEFLLIALARCKRNEDISFDTDKLLRTFKEELDDQSSICEFRKVLEKQLKIFSSFFICISRDGNKVDYKFQRKDSKDIWESNFTETGDNLKRRLKGLQSFLHVSTEPHHWLVPAFNWCRDQQEEKADAKISAEKFIEELERIDNDLIKNKRQLTSIEELDKMTYGNVSHYWFYRLDYELWKLRRHEEGKKIWSKCDKDQKVKNLLDDFRFRRCSSVEHINPQNPMEGKPDKDDSFGNLALISRSQNSKFSNIHRDGKKGIILNSGFTESLKMAHFLWCSNKNVKEAGGEMYDILYDAVKDYL